MQTDTPVIEIGGRRIGRGAPCFVIAEIGMNHNGDEALAADMVRAAAGCGADAVKFQTFFARHFVTRDALVYGEDRGDQPRTQVEMLEPYELSESAWADLKKTAEEQGLLFLSTPLDEPSVDLLESLGVKAFKIASCDVTNIPLIRRIARLGKPAVLSTGMSTLGVVDGAVEAFCGCGNRDLALMQCTSSYPARNEDANLRVIRTLERAFGLPVGFSDHCRNNYAAFASVVMGASLIEKHFTVDHDLPGVDQKMSLNPAEFKDLVEGVRGVEASLGRPEKRVSEAERDAREGGRRGIVASRFIPKGAEITPDMVTAKRPAGGISPANIDLVVGRRAKRDIPEDAFLSWEDL